MNIRIVAICLTLVTSLALAQEPRKPAKAMATERAAMLQTLQKGKPLTAGRERYQHLPEVLAVTRGAKETPEQALARFGASGGQLLESKGRMVLFRSAQQKPAFVERVGGLVVYPTVLNNRTGTFGVLLGTLVVKPRNMADAAAIAGSHGLEKAKEYPHLQTVFYRVKSNMDIADAAAALQADPRVESAYPEILEHVRLPK